jgi:hypothetical protein
MTEFEALYAKLKALLANDDPIEIADLERLNQIRPK